jgi:hypothetical protein
VDPTLLPPTTRSACQAAVVAATAATEAAGDSAAAAATNHPSSCRDGPLRGRGGSGQDFRDVVVSVTSTERRELPAKLEGFMGDE